jgi:hypothetical protein
MTLPPAATPPPDASSSSSPAQPAPGSAGGRRANALTFAGAVLSLFAVGLGAFLLHLTVLSAVEQYRVQQVQYADFRIQLARATAPVGQLVTVDVGDGLAAEDQAVAIGAPVALMSSARLDLDGVVVFFGTDAGVLSRGPGLWRTSAFPGQPGLTQIHGRAWTYGGPFGGLDQLVPGDVITFTTGQGEHRYEVTGTRRQGDARPPFRAGEGRLTLVSATGPFLYPGSVIYVDATLTTPPVQRPVPAYDRSFILPAEQPMASDQRAWVPATLYLLALAAAALAAAWLALRWGPRPTWIVAFPVLALLAVLASRELSRLLPNLM